MVMDYMKETKDISAEEAIILWQASRLSLSKSYEKAPEILKVHGSVNLSAFLDTVGSGQTAPEQFGYTQYSVHILPFCVRYWLGLHFRMTGSVLA